MHELESGMQQGFRYPSPIVRTFPSLRSSKAYKINYLGQSWHALSCLLLRLLAGCGLLARSGVIQVDNGRNRMPCYELFFVFWKTWFCHSYVLLQQPGLFLTTVPCVGCHRSRTRDRRPGTATLRVL